MRICHFSAHILTVQRGRIKQCPEKHKDFFLSSFFSQQPQTKMLKTVGVGEDVNLTCKRQVSHMGKLFWIRLVSGNLAELLGGTYSFDHNFVNKTLRFATKQETGTFLLHINETEQSDTGLYYCIKVEGLDMKFLKGTFLRIKGAEPEITTNFQLPPSDPVRPGDSVTLQCSVLFDSEKKTCPGDHSVYWFRAGSDEAHPSFIYAHGNNRDHCKKIPESESTQKCDYFFSKNVSSSDAGTHYCAVATCGEILFGNGTKLEIEGKSGIFLYNCSNCIFLCLISECRISILFNAGDQHTSVGVMWYFGYSSDCYCLPVVYEEENL
uniref:Ig-like domain-containing protein n=1 Tax=Echeneis naucrates TaxID=173247 RepID=A0A665WDE1_ECHNA